MSRESNLRLLNAISDESRYRIVELLFSGEKCACQIPSLINKTQSNTSMHLAKLKESGVLKSRRDGKKIVYSIKDPRILDVFKALNNKKGVK